MKHRPSAAHELPQDLPAGEHVLWQGGPAFWPLARSLHIRWLFAYFGALLVVVAVQRALTMPAALASSLIRFGVLSGVVIGLHVLYSLMVARTTSYTLTNRRFVLQAGIALPVSVNIPWSKIETAQFVAQPDSSGNIVIGLHPGERVSYVLLWPHVIGGRIGARPMLRAVANVARVAKLMRRQLEATEMVEDELAPRAAAAPASLSAGSRLAAA